MVYFRPGIVFAVACAGFVVGVAGASFSLSFFGVVFGGGGVFCLALLLRKVLVRWRDAAKFFGVAVCFVWLGYVRHAGVQPGEFSVAQVADGSLHALEGSVVRVEGDEAKQRMTLAQVFVDGGLREDLVQVKMSIFADVAVGDIVRFSCKLKRPEPFDDFAYDRFLAAKDILATCSIFSSPDVVGKDASVVARFFATIDALHRFVVRMIDVVFPDSHAQLLAGLLIGDDAFSSVWKERFLRTGTSHIVAASGSNVALTVSLLLAGLFGAGIPRKIATVFVFVGIAMFVVLAGGESAVVRAGIMAALVVFARATGRVSSVRNVLLCTVCVMLWHEPRILRDDVGFQLSVLSTMGLVWWSKSFSAFFSFLPERFGLREGFSTTLAATLATLPVTLWSMGQISFVGSLVNLLVLPLLPLAMAFGAFATVVGMVSPWAGRVVAFSAWWVLDVVLMVLREFSAFSFAYGEVQKWMLDAIVGFAGGIGVLVRWIFSLRRRVVSCSAPPLTLHDRDVFSSVIPVLLFGGLFFVSFAQHVVRDGWFSSDVRVWVFDVGQGDALFIDTPEKDVVIDAGPNTLLPEKLGAVLPWFDRHIDYALATHPDADHVTGFASFFSRYDVSMLGESGQGCDTFFCAPFAQSSFRRMQVAQGDVLLLAPGVTLSVVWPAHTYAGEILDDANTTSLVMLLQTPTGSMLFTGDADAVAEAQYLPLLSHVDVLKLGHHGSGSSTSSVLLEKITPTFGIVSAGEENRYGHPHTDVLARLTHFGVTVFRTDTQGDIRIEFGKFGVRVSAVPL